MSKVRTWLNGMLAVGQMANIATTVLPSTAHASEKLPSQAKSQTLKEADLNRLAQDLDAVESLLPYAQKAWGAFANNAIANGNEKLASARCSSGVGRGILDEVKRLHPNADPDELKQLAQAELQRRFAACDEKAKGDKKVMELRGRADQDCSVAVSLKPRVEAIRQTVLGRESALAGAGYGGLVDNAKGLLKTADDLLDKSGCDLDGGKPMS